MGGRKKTSSVGRGERKPVLSAKVLRGILALGIPGVVEKLAGEPDGRESAPDAQDFSDARRAFQFANETLAFRAKEKSRGLRRAIAE